ncbi:MAG: alpha-2-macroglobulin family protein [Elusimicrobia bacterium]|nr:alpha-2-macroglobulin family protein [Elusimicrobiota bacterium]
MSEQAPEKSASWIERLVRWCLERIKPIIGEVTWQPPAWLARLTRPSEAAGWRDKLKASAAHAQEACSSRLKDALLLARQDPKRFWRIGGPVLAAVILLPLALQWYQHRPKIVRFSVTGTSPAATKPADSPVFSPIRITFGGSAARLDKVGKPIGQGISISPRIPGIWQWDSDRRLTFSPKEDWKVAQEYIVRFERSLFPDHVHLERYDYKFKSAPFGMTFAAADFYQDPTNPKLKKVVATVAFTHPVEPAEFEKHVALRLANQTGGFLGLGAKTYPFTVLYDKFKSEAYIHSDPVEIPMKDTYMMVSIDAGVSASRGGPEAGKAERQVPIPGMYNFFRVESAEVTLVRNERYEPERALILQLSAGALETEIRKALSVYELPRDFPPHEGRPAMLNYRWGDPARVGPEILALSRPVELVPLPTDREYAKTHSFKFAGTPGRYLYIRVNKGIGCYGGYVLAKEYDHTAQIPEFPKELKIMYEGAILSLSGEKKVSIISRDIDAIRFEASRVVSSQINHLVSQSAGRFRDPQFNYNFGPDNISERLSEVRVLNAEPGRSVYSSFDLSDYLTMGSDGSRRGLFFFKVESWDPVRKVRTGVEDKRLVLVTDLGLLVKDVLGGGHEVFVQSISDGSPVGGAQVVVLGRNGLPVLTETTDGDGRARFPSLRGFERERAPVAYVVRRGSDLAFMPYDWEDRRLNFSRFDVGGAATPGSGERLQAYLFSDRGIYRPGDEFRVGLIVKPADWLQNIAGVPLEATVTDSRGLEVHRQKMVLSGLGFEELRYATEETSPTGAWTVSVYVVKDGRRAALLGSTTLRIEEFLPDRLRIATRLSKERVDGWVTPKDLKATVFLKNLFGTPASGRRVKAQVMLSPALPVFRAFPDHTFFDPQRAKNSFTERLEDGETDDKGEAEFALDLDRFDKATYRLNFTAEGFEAGGGRSVAAESSVLVSPRDFLLGYKPDGDLRYIAKGSARSVELVAVDPALKKTGVKGLQAHLLELRYVSLLVRQENGTYKYESILKELPLEKKELSIPESGLRHVLPTGQPGDYALVLRDDADTELCRVVFSVAGQANLTRSLDKTAELKVQLSKADYAPNEEIEVQITAPYTGAGLITIERDRVYAHRWFRTTTTASTQRIRIPADMEGNGYVVVSFLRSLESPEIFMSPLSYGVAPFSVSRARRTNPVSLDCPDLARPGQPYRIRYRADKPGKIVVFAVDEGILQVAGYKTPDPLGRFFEKRALEVRTAQILDLVLPEFKLVQSLSAPGGDMGREALGKNLNPFKRKRDKPVAYWSGIIDVDPTSREVTYTVPDHFNGTLRVMAVAVAAESIGVAEKRAIIRGHFVLSPNAPVVVAPGDEFEVSMGVANQAEGSGPDAELEVELKTSEHLEVLGGQTRRVKVAEGRETSVAFKLRAKDKLGSGNMTFTAALGDRKSRASVDASVRPPQPFMSTLAGGVMKGGAAEVPVVRAMYPHYRTLEASISPLPLVLARGLLRYLERFPYGCTEQLVSQAFPALVLRTHPDFGYSPQATGAALEQVLRVLRGRQNTEGAFGFWAANSHYSDVQTVYALHFLTEAKERGYPVPPDLLNRGLAYLGGLVGTEPGTLAEARVRAYAAYILTRNGTVLSAPLAALRRHVDDKFPKVWRKDLTGIYLAAVYKLLRQTSQAEGVIGSSRLGDPQQADYASYYDGLVRDSQLLYILARHFPERLRDVSSGELERLVDPVVKGSFNTLSGAYAILALASYADTAGAPAVSGVKVAETRRDGTTKSLSLTGNLFPKADFSDQAKLVRFSSPGSRPLFYGVTTAGFDLAPPTQEMKNRIEVQREYRFEGGGVTSKLGLGGKVEVHVKVRTIGGESLSDIAIVDLLPGGFEVVMEPQLRDSAPRGTMFAGEEDEEGYEGGESAPPSREGWASPLELPSSTWHPQYADIREDRVVLFGVVGSEAKEFVYSIRATNRGAFSVPPIFAEAMYDRSIQARNSAGKMVVEGD